MDKRKPQIGFYGNHDSHVEVERKGNSKWFSKCSRVVGISHTFDVMTENRAHMQNECENQVTTSEHYASYESLRPEFGRILCNVTPKMDCHPNTFFR